MLTPPNTYSIEWLNETCDRMKELQAKLERTFPAHLFAFVAQREISTIQWQQRYGEEDPLLIIGLDLDVDFSNPEDREARLASLEQEVEALLLSIPVCVMVELFGYEHWVVFHEDSFNSHYDEMGYYMEERDLRRREDYPEAPAGSLAALLHEFDTLRAQAAEALQAQLQRLLTESPAHPSALRWVQYSPYFNDGELCIFALQEDPSADVGDGAFAPFEPLAELVSAVHPEVLLRLFGNHAQVTLRESGFTTEPYSKHN